MRNITRTLLGLGIAAAWLWTSSSAFAQLGGGGGGGGSGGGGGGGSSGGGGSGGGSSNGSAGSVGSNGVTQPTSIAGDSLLGSFNNTGTGRSGASSAISTSNLFATTYYNPYQQGLLVSNGQTFTPVSSAGFGQAVFGNISTGSGSSSRTGFGSTGGANRTGTGFGGTSTGGSTMFGSSGSGSTGFGGGSSGFGTGSAGIRSGSTTGMTFTGGNFGASIGRTGPVIGSALNFAAAPRPEFDRRNDLQGIVARSTHITAPAGVNVGMDSGTVVIRGTVANADQSRLVENMIRLQPGVHEVRNELQVTGGNP
jgi:hypothetical protein